MVVVKNAPRLNDTSSLAALEINFPRFQEWNALLPESLKTVNTIFDALITNLLLLELCAVHVDKRRQPIEERWHVQHSIGDSFTRTTHTGDPSPGISGTEILWPGQRRGARPC